ncbi:L,D-transpeptidase family protein [uncultured Arcticibacterium sp.]|uniref:L,D-transpeptidase family protein n=1 Tax=uncultured Arcticibacterium sp. TaxID=2173042 RepID=UPI0030F97786
MKQLLLLFTLICFSAYSQDNLPLLANERNISLPLNARNTINELAYQIHFGKTPKLLSYNALKEKIDSSNVEQWLKVATKSSSIEPFLSHLEPDFSEYTSSLKYKYHPDYYKLGEFQNFFRWLNRYKHDSFILINVASNELVFYKNNQPWLSMNVIVGTAKNKTPIMATEADAVMVYPYWTATKNIALNEILPKVKEDISYLDRNNFEVLNEKYQIINPTTIKWDSVNAKNFKYKFRQGTGCDNSLGLLKINIKNPYSVYMHDVPHTVYSQGLFSRDSRFFSHGCIRLERPLDLAKLLEPKESIDDDLLEKCLINQKPRIIELKQNTPIFVMYFTDYIDQNGTWKSVKDYYKIVKYD